MDIENKVYKVYAEQRPKEILHSGNIWECERWIRANGTLGVAYVIEHIKDKPKKPIKTDKPKVLVSKSSNKVEPLF